MDSDIELPPVMAAGSWATNADLIADCARLGYLRKEWRTIDPTWGGGKFWTVWQPDVLVGSDINPERSPTGTSVDATDLPYDDGSFQAVVIDPPYKLNGTSTGAGPSALDHPFGVERYASWQDRHILMTQMLTEGERVLAKGGYLLFKCQDQVCSGKVRWQTREFSDHGESLGLTLEDWLNFPGSRPQPSGRRQLHARRNYSTLLVFKK